MRTFFSSLILLMLSIAVVGCGSGSEGGNATPRIQGGGDPNTPKLKAAQPGGDNKGNKGGQPEDAGVQ